MPLSLIQGWFDDYFDVDARIASAEWTSFYRIHRRIADAFQVGRGYLVGDAAHVHAPAGGQGMNLGIGDAFNLAWKLALVAKRDARPELLESYEAERRPVAVIILKGADRGFELEVTNNVILEWFRMHIFPLVLRFVGRFQGLHDIIFRLFSQTWIGYQNSPVVAGLARGNDPRAGDRPPYGVFEAGEHRGRGLFELLRGVDHQILLFEGQQAEATLGDLARPIEALLRDYRIDARVISISAANQNLHRRYGVDRARFFLLRPDGHIGFAASPDQLAEFRTYLSRFYLEHDVPWPMRQAL